jgi:hypothetical protein
MNNVTFVETTNPLTNEPTEYAIIDRGNGEYTSMLKSTYDAQQVAQATLASELSNPSTPQAGA